MTDPINDNDRRVIETIQAAAAATAAVRQKVDLASECLAEFRCSTNALGVLSQPHDMRLSLRAAREHLDAAIALIDAAKWPTARDYDQT